MNDMANHLLYNGVEIPPIGFGPGIFRTYRPASRIPAWNLPFRAWNKYFGRSLKQRQNRKEYVNAVASGLRTGFRLLDFSTSYGDGTLMREAIQSSGIRRDDLFLTCRISNRSQFEGQDAVRELVKRQLDEYGINQFDLLMFHWPVTGIYEETWKTICRLYEHGVARSIGVANCHPHHLKCLMTSGMKPMVNQFEIHPLLSQKEFVKFNQDNGILVEAYTPIARNDDRLMRLPKLLAIAQAHGKSPVQVVLRWHIQLGVIPVIKSLNAQRQVEDFSVFDFSLSQEEMQVIDSFNINARVRFDPDNCDFTIL